MIYTIKPEDFHALKDDTHDFRFVDVTFNQKTYAAAIANATFQPETNQIALKVESIYDQINVFPLSLALEPSTEAPTDHFITPIRDKTRIYDLLTFTLQSKSNQPEITTKDKVLFTNFATEIMNLQRLSIFE